MSDAWAGICAVTCGFLKCFRILCEVLESEKCSFSVVYKGKPFYTIYNVENEVLKQHKILVDSIGL